MPIKNIKKGKQVIYVNLPSPCLHVAMFIYRTYSGHKLIGETAYRNPYTIPKTTTPVKKIVPFSAFLHLLLNITAPKQGGKRGQKQ